MMSPCVSTGHKWSSTATIYFILERDVRSSCTYVYQEFKKFLNWLVSTKTEHKFCQKIEKSNKCFKLFFCLNCAHKYRKMSFLINLNSCRTAHLQTYLEDLKPFVLKKISTIFNLMHNNAFQNDITNGYIM